MSHPTDKIITRVIELSGGKAALIEETDKKLDFINDKWGQDVVAIGRILRAHLFVEYFMTKCIQTVNPKLGDLDEARISYNQKINLLKGCSKHIDQMIPGIKRLNIIRNRVAHNLTAEITDQDIESIFSDQSFKALRDAHTKPNKPSADKFEIIEDFAKHVGSYLDSEGEADSLAQRFKQAFKESENET